MSLGAGRAILGVRHPMSAFVSGTRDSCRGLYVRRETHYVRDDVNMGEESV